MKNSKLLKQMLAGPYLLWSAAFIIIPLIMVFYYGLTDKSGAFTFDNILAIATAEHSKALWEALKLSVISTVICLLLAYPLAMILCNMNVNQNSFLVLIFILPMWMNFLLRTYAWMSLLEHNGIINRFLGLLGVGPFNMINTSGAVVLGITVRGKEEALKQETDYQFCVPDITDFMLPSLSILPLQLFAYYVALQRGCDIDKPRNLAKSVTVE